MLQHKTIAPHYAVFSVLFPQLLNPVKIENNALVRERVPWGGKDTL